MKIAVNYMSSCALLLCAAATFAQQPTTADAPAKPADSAAAQPKPSKATAQSEAGEPRANTSATAPSTARAAAAAAPSAAGPGAAAPAAAAPAAAQKSSSAADKLQLGTATVTGDREQPKVMYVVPWKKSDIGDLGGKPMNSLVDEILAPVDRDVFKREVSYYRTVNSEASQNGAQPPAGQGEK